MKKCKYCGVELTPENWTGSRKKNHYHICDICYREKRRSYDARWRALHKGHKRGYTSVWNRKYSTGVTDFEFQKKLSGQNNRCGICQKEFVFGQGNHKLRPCQDHCHITKKLRDVLCARCNSILGFCDEDKEILLCAVRYLEKYQGEFQSSNSLVSA